MRATGLVEMFWERRMKTLGNGLVLMSETSADGVMTDPVHGDLVYTFAVSHWLREALEHGFLLEEAIAEFDRQAFPRDKTANVEVKAAVLGRP